MKEFHIRTDQNPVYKFHKSSWANDVQFPYNSVSEECDRLFDFFEGIRLDPKLLHLSEQIRYL